MFYIAPTSRLAYYLKNTSSQDHIFTLSEWLDSCYHFDSEWQRLTPLQSTLLWQDIIQAEALPLLRPQAVTAQVQQAWLWLQQWQIPLSELKTAIAKAPERKNISDMEMFFKWAEIYEKRCLENKWIDDAQVPTFLREHFIKPNDLQPICLYGFDYITPQLKQFFNYLKSLGLSVEEKALPRIHAELTQYHSYPDEVSEWRAASVWARELLNKNDQQPIRVGIVIPELAQYWLKIQGIFIETFMADSLLKGQSDQTPLFNLDAGLPFNQYPLISMTLTLLRSLMRKLPYQEMSTLLRSAFWKGQSEELSFRAQLTAALADKGYQQLGLGSLVNYLQKDPKQTCPELLHLLRVTCLKRKEWPKTDLPSVWISQLKNLFETLDWPNGRTLNSAEYQTWQRFLLVLDEVAGLDKVSGAINYHQLLKVIQTEVQRFCFQAETPTTSVQVMGILETSGMSFDYLWVSGLSADAWPPAAQSNPFIPPALQRHYGLPHASYVQELAFAQQFTEHWRNAAQHIIFSYPKTAQAKECLPSPLIESRLSEWSLQEPILPDWKSNHKEIISNVKNDMIGLPISYKEAGSSLIKDQAECPFRSYANYRLGLNRHQLQEPELLGSAIRRGNVVHGVLELLWAQLKTKKALIEFSSESINEHVVTYVEKALSKEYEKELKSNSIPSVFFQVEKDRIKELIVKWLEKEKLREDFSVHKIEQAVYLDFDGIKINLRIDRLDKTPDNNTVIIDYKTNKPPSPYSDDQRLVNPQMPLYAMIQPTSLVGAVFAQVAGEFTGFTGWVEESYSQSLPKLSSKSLVSVSLAEQKKIWQEKVDVLISEFKQGYAKVDPYPNESACHYCNLYLFCRIRSGEVS